MKVRGKFHSFFGAAFVFAAFFVVCVLPSTAAAVGPPNGQAFYSSGYKADSSMWPIRPIALKNNTAFTRGGLFDAGTVRFTAADFTIGEAGVTATILVERVDGTEGPITVEYAATSGTAVEGQDFSTTFGTIFWSDGDDDLRGFTIPINDDGLAEGNETVILTLSNVVGGAVIGSPNPAFLTIVDNEQSAVPSISIGDVTQAEGSGPNPMVFTATLSAPAAQGVSVTVNYATADGTATAPSDFTAIIPTQVLTFAPGQTSKTISVNINGDSLVEPNETFVLNLSGASHATIADAQAVGTLVNDDTAGISGSLQFSSLTYSVNENASTATITVTRAGGSSGAVSVQYATSNGTAAAGQDYTAVSGTLAWDADDTAAKSFVIPIINDASEESNETVNITLSNASGGATLGTPATSQLTIVDNDSVPSVSVSDVSQSEGNAQNQMLFTVTLNHAASQTVTVTYATENGTANAVTDYTPIGLGTLVFSPGETSKQIAVTILGDFVIEPDETFFLNLTGAVNAAMFDSQGVGTILNDDGAGVIRFELADYTVNEGAGTAVITVRRTGGLAAGVTVQYFSVDGSATSGADYSRVSGTLTFAPDQTTQSFTIPIHEDQIDEPDETINLVLDAPSGGATLGSPINAILTIVDNDGAPTLSINDISKNEGDTGTTQFTFTVSMAGASATPITVNYATSNGTALAPGDYAAVPNGVVTFEPGQTSKSITVIVNGDYNRESNESFFVDLSGPVGAVIGDSQGMATILNDDLGGAFRFSSAGYSVGEPAGVLTVTVLRTGGLANSVTVNYSTASDTAIAGADFTAVTGTLTFTGGQTSASFNVPIANDGIRESNETFMLILSDATGGGTLGVPNTAQVTITDQSPTIDTPTPFDFDADGRSDLAVRRPSDNTWYVQRGTAGYTTMEFGVPGDLMVPADYDGDGKTDIATFRGSNSTWYIFNSLSQTFQTYTWGVAGDLPVPADHDGDGKADLVIFRPSTGTWYTRFSNNSFSTVSFGMAGDKPLIGDFDGDGKHDIAIYRPSDGSWYILKTGFGFFGQTWGIAGDVPVPADYDGDGETDVAVWRPSTGQWLRIGSTAGVSELTWGVKGDKLVPADYDGDGKADAAVFRPSNGTWYIVGTTGGQLIQNFGQNGDLPVQSSFIY